MTIRERIIDYLQRHPEGVDDDLLTKALSLRQRQIANQYCRRLAGEELVERRPVRGKIHNFWVGNPGPGGKPPQPEPVIQTWYWEGNVQAFVVQYLSAQNYRIRSVANTARHERGKDIVAERDGHQVWISAKGYPEDTQKTRASTQAGHWFKDVVFDMLIYREEDKSAELGIALPDFPRYRDLAAKIAWLKPVAGFVYYWVQENGSVIAE